MTPVLFCEQFLGAGVLAVLLVGAEAVAGATCVVNDYGGADFREHSDGGGGGMTCLTPVLVAAVAGVGAGAEWDVYPGAGTPIQDAIDGVEVGDAIYVHAETNARECGCEQATYA